MTLPTLAFLVALAAVGLLAYWHLVMAEGAYLGERAVRGLYDWGAPTYDAVKQYDHAEEVAFLGRPLLERLEETAGDEALVLDVAAGTGRLAVALLDSPFFRGTVVGLDTSRRMLEEAARKTAPHAGRVPLLHASAAPLPFADAGFDAVTMLEALEFLPDRAAALEEAVRMLRPGGWLLVTNRVGSDTRWFPGRREDPARFADRLVALGLDEIVTLPWQEYYDLVFARRPGELVPRPAPAWADGLRCSGCGVAAGWTVEVERARCRGCGATLPLAADGRIWRIRDAVRTQPAPLQEESPG